MYSSTHILKYLRTHVITYSRIHVIMYSSTHTYIYILPLQGLTQKSATKLNLALWPRNFILNGLSYIQKMPPHHIKKYFCKKFPDLTHELQCLSFNVSWQVLTSHCQEVQDLDACTLFITCTSLLTDLVYSPPTFCWTWHHIATIKFVDCILKVIFMPNLWCDF